MTPISDLLIQDRIVCDAKVSSKKRVLELLSELIAQGGHSLRQPDIFDSLVGRERLGSTGLGDGVAIPHGRLEGSQDAIGAFAKLESGVNFDAADSQPVDLLFALIVPEHFTDEHLQVLAHLAEMFSNSDLCQRLRSANSSDQILELLTYWQSRDTHP